MFELLPLKSFLTSAASRAILGLTNYRTDDPQLIKKRYFFDIRDALSKKYPEPPEEESPDRTKHSTVTASKLRGHARW